ncbi:annexin-like protein RJ4 [Asparagus officinalis]|uniref:annexin-like protein RJ4 n=1 Tax=Asparagus officinalis TaxID=4686 RepID=UPI00098E5B55|nr:annexin-like protein RJ4 [Asparagus officinalis]
MATIRVPEMPPSPFEDALDLKNAFEGWGTDEKTVIGILSHRDEGQRKKIMSAYEELYNENLINRLEKELSGDLQEAIYFWMFDPIERSVIMANIAARKSIDYQVIVEIACVNSPDELLAIKKVYHARYKQSLEEDVASHTTGDFRKLLVALVSTYRYDGVEINETLAELEAKTLHNSIVQKSFHHDEIVRILSTRSRAQLNATFNHYKDEYGTSISKDLSTSLSNEYVSALRIAIRCIISPQKYYEKVLRHAMKKAGTDEDALTRVIVTRAEKDLEDIKELYQKRTNVTLESAVHKEISGNYKKFLLALVEE